MSNWKNVNNWHWTSKNCIDWTKEYLKANLTTLEVEHEGITVKTLKMTECSGDAELNQRKGKLIPIYDLAIELTWSGITVDGTEVTGNIKTPELLHGSETDCEFEITVDDDDGQKDTVKQVIRKHLAPLLIEKFKNLGKDMVETHGKDVYIDPSQLGTSNKGKIAPSEPIAVSTPVTATNISEAATTTTSTSSEITTPKVPSSSIPSSSSSSSVKTKLNTTTINEKIEMQTSADQIYETLFDPGRVAAWTRSRPDIFRHVGSKFNLFDGNVTGTILELVPNEKIVQTWRLRSWPEDHYSTVTLKFEQSSDHTIIHLTQEGIPIGEVETVRRNWQNYYWNSIKSVFGFGALL